MISTLDGDIVVKDVNMVGKGYGVVGEKEAH